MRNMVKSNPQRPSLIKGSCLHYIIRFAVRQTTFLFYYASPIPDFDFAMHSVLFNAFVGQPCACPYLSLSYAFQHCFCPCLVFITPPYSRLTPALHYSTPKCCSAVFLLQRDKRHYALATLVFTLSRC